MTSDNVVGKVVRIKPNDFSCPIGVSRIKSLIYNDDNDRFELIGVGFRIHRRYVEFDPKDISISERILSFIKGLGWIGWNIK